MHYLILFLRSTKLWIVTLIRPGSRGAWIKLNKNAIWSHSATWQQCLILFYVPIRLHACWNSIFFWRSCLGTALHACTQVFKCCSQIQIEDSIPFRMLSSMQSSAKCSISFHYVFYDCVRVVMAILSMSISIVTKQKPQYPDTIILTSNCKYFLNSSLQASVQPSH